jgi:hypothetical protein
LAGLALKKKKKKRERRKKKKICWPFTAAAVAVLAPTRT